jgi:hypothetical protein
MKKIFLISLIAAAFLTSCNKDSEGVSSVTSYPTVELKGDQALTVLVNGTYTESGVVALEGTKDISSSVKMEGSVDVTKTGVYTIKYTATNKDGFTASARRYVGVITPAAAALDISGTYRRNAGAQGFAIVSKTSYPGLYINNNPGGATSDGTIAGTSVDNILIYMFQLDATVISAPSQDSKVGEFACTGGVYDGTNKLYKWVCVNAGYGTAVRTFIKQ